MGCQGPGPAWSRAAALQQRGSRAARGGRPSGHRPRQRGSHKGGRGTWPLVVAPKDSARGAERPPTVAQCRKVVQAARHGKGSRPTLETTKLRNAYERKGRSAPAAPVPRPLAMPGAPVPADPPLATPWRRYHGPVQIPWECGCGFTAGTERAFLRHTAASAGTATAPATHHATMLPRGSAPACAASDAGASACPAAGCPCCAAEEQLDGLWTEEATAGGYYARVNPELRSETVVTNGAEPVQADAVRGRSGQPDEAPSPEGTQEKGVDGAIDDVQRDKGIGEGGPLASSFFRSQARQGPSQWRPALRMMSVGQDDERQEEKASARAVREATAARADEHDDGVGQRSGEGGMRTARELLKCGQGREAFTRQGPKQAAVDLRRDGDTSEHTDNGYTGDGLEGPDSLTTRQAVLSRSESCTPCAEASAKSSLEPAGSALAEGTNEPATWQDKEVDTKWSPEGHAGAGGAAPS
ncbi:hypothetical protein KFL_007250010, partial [Klebsormidium nitens]